jgi:general secretion pathway protein E
MQLYKGPGCENCLGTGYFGRTGVFELLIIDDDIKELITKRKDSHIIKKTAIEKGMTTLREDGLHKALAGETTLEEVYRVTQDSVQTDTGAIEYAGNRTQFVK